MTVGTVKWFSPVKGYGWIEPEGEYSKDVFVHISAIKRAGLPGLREGQRVQFELVTNDRCKTSAENISPLD